MYTCHMGCQTISGWLTPPRPAYFLAIASAGVVAITAVSVDTVRGTVAAVVVGRAGDPESEGDDCIVVVSPVGHGRSEGGRG